MDTAEMEKILDALDRRVALGEIDISTYKQLKAKFSARTDYSEEPVSATLTALPKEAVSLQCPGCMAPLPVPGDPSQVSVTCDYCGGTFALQTASEEMDRLKSEIRKWISQVAGNAGVGTTVDEASRKFIFNDKLLPPLKNAADRATDVFSLTRYQSLFTFSLLTRLSSSPFHYALQSAPDLTHLVDKIRETVVRVQSPEIRVFAIGEKEKYELHALELRCLEVGYLSNVRHHLANPTSDGFQKAKTNLRALNELYNTTGQLVSSIDPASAGFSKALAARMGLLEEAVTVLEDLFSGSDGVMTDYVADNLELIATRLEQTAFAIEATGMRPREAVPAAEGTRNDADSIRIFAISVRFYGQCGAEAGIPFTRLLASLEEVVEEAQTPSSDVRWLSAFLSNLTLHMESIAGEAPLPIVSDFGWAEGKMVSLVKSSFFGGKESVQGEMKILLPFWVAELEFPQQKGVIFKKGASASGLILTEAMRYNKQCFVIASDDLLSNQYYDAIRSRTTIGYSTPAIAPVVGSDDALKYMKQFISSTQGYSGGSVRQLHLAYLPVVIARYYTQKSERREILTPSNSIILSKFDPQPINIGTKEVLFARL